MKGYLHKNQGLLLACSRKTISSAIRTVEFERSPATMTTTGRSGYRDSEIATSTPSIALRIYEDTTNESNNYPQRQSEDPITSD